MSASMSTPSHTREVHGRAVNSENARYALPADQPEYDRLDKQHRLHKLALGSLYTPETLVREALAPQEGVKRRIADLGTGSGIWAVEMALEFPHADVIGLDLVPNFSRPTPPNCRFERADMTRDLSRYTEGFDVIHIRSATTTIVDTAAFTTEVLGILKDNGVLLFVDGDLYLLGEDMRPAELVPEGQPGHSYVFALWMEAAKAMRSRGINVVSGPHQRPWMEANDAFINIGSLSVQTPVGAWLSGTSEETERMNIIGEMMGQNAREFMRSLRPLLIGNGTPEAVVDEQIARAEEELRTRNAHLYSQWHYSWGQKRCIPVA